MVLEGKNAVVYGAGNVGAAAARGFAREGAAVFIANRTGPKAEKVATAIREEGGRATAGEVDVLEPAQVDDFVDRVVHDAGSMRRQFSVELGDKDVRFVTLRTGGTAETMTAAMVNVSAGALLDF